VERGSAGEQAEFSSVATWPDEVVHLVRAEGLRIAEPDRTLDHEARLEHHFPHHRT
jgi:hypothetical protein